MKREIKYVVNTQILYKLQNIFLTKHYNILKILYLHIICKIKKMELLLYKHKQTNKQTPIRRSENTNII